MPQPSDPLVVRLLRQQRDALLLREDRQVLRLARAWLTIENGLRDEMLLLAHQIADEALKGSVITEQLIARMGRYRLLDAQLRSQILDYAKNIALPDIAAEQAIYGQLGLDGAVAALKASFTFAPNFRLLAADAFKDYVGFLGNKAPLYTLLREAYPDALDGVVKGLLNGFAKGLNPNQIAAQMSKGMGLGLERITLIARTEQLRVWRVSTMAQYQASGVVRYGKRLSARDDRVCPACLFADGDIVPLDSNFSDHPRGRCTVVPIVIGAPELKWQTGQQWFMKQSPDVQKNILGEGMYNEWKSEGFNLKIVSGMAESEVWGDAPRTLTLSEVQDIVDAGR